MHPVAKKCVQWAVALFVFGVLAQVYLPDAYLKIAQIAGANANAGMGVVNLVCTLLEWVTLPLGGSMVGAAVVISVLAPREPEEDEVPERAARLAGPREAGPEA